MAVAEPNLTRTLLRLNGTTRKSVGVVLINDDTGIKQADRSTDEFGRFSINYSRFADGTYHLEYYGDGIIPTVFSSDGNVLVEDPVTP